MAGDSVPSDVCAVGTPATAQAQGLISGPPSPDSGSSVDQTLIFTLSHVGSVIRNLQQKDADIGQVLAWLEHVQRPPRWRLKDASRGEKRLWHAFPRLTLWRDFYVELFGCLRQGKVLGHLHGAPLTAHLAYERVLARARSVCYWPSMHSDIRS
ncbi:hypothetical protein F7725_009500, partial [Dissostichus mawsoni]